MVTRLCVPAEEADPRPHRRLGLRLHRRSPRRDGPARRRPFVSPHLLHEKPRGPRGARRGRAARSDWRRRRPRLRGSPRRAASRRPADSPEGSLYRVRSFSSLYNVTLYTAGRSLQCRNGLVPLRDGGSGTTSHPRRRLNDPEKRAMRASLAGSSRRSSRTGFCSREHAADTLPPGARAAARRLTRGGRRLPGSRANGTSSMTVGGGVRPPPLMPSATAAPVGLRRMWDAVLIPQPRPLAAENQQADLGCVSRRFRAGRRADRQSLSRQPTRHAMLSGSIGSPSARRPPTISARARRDLDAFIACAGTAATWTPSSRRAARAARGRRPGPGAAPTAEAGPLMEVWRRPTAACYQHAAPTASPDGVRRPTTGSITRADRREDAAWQARDENDTAYACGPPGRTAPTRRSGGSLGQLFPKDSGRGARNGRQQGK